MQDTPYLLIVEDDASITDFLKLRLERQGYRLGAAGTGRQAMELFRQERPKLIMLDLGLPDLDGEEVCKRLRAQSDVPILVLTARDRVADKVELLQLGADDYLTKPFSFDELLARIQALLRRSGAAARDDTLTFMDMELHLSTREVLRGAKEIELSVREFDLLHFLMTNPRRVLTRQVILNQVWGYEYEGESNLVQVYIGRLRRKLGDPPVIDTVHGVGYRLKEP